MICLKTQQISLINVSSCAAGADNNGCDISDVGLLCHLPLIKVMNCSLLLPLLAIACILPSYEGTGCSLMPIRLTFCTLPFHTCLHSWSIVRPWGMLTSWSGRSRSGSAGEGRHTLWTEWLRSMRSANAFGSCSTSSNTESSCADGR